MGTVNARVELLGYHEIRERFLRAPTAVQVEAVRVIHEQTIPMMAAMHSLASTPIERHGVNSVGVFNDQLGVELRGGAKGTALDQVLFRGAEFGGQKKKKVVYARRSPLGKAHIVRRRTTMQFKPHLGKRGYFFFPTVREWLPKIQAAIGEHVVKVLG